MRTEVRVSGLAEDVCPCLSPLFFLERWEVLVRGWFNHVLKHNCSLVLLAGPSLLPTPPSLVASCWEPAVLSCCLSVPPSCWRCREHSARNLHLCRLLSGQSWVLFWWCGENRVACGFPQGHLGVEPGPRGSQHDPLPGRFTTRCSLGGHWGLSSFPSVTGVLSFLLKGLHWVLRDPRGRCVHAFRACPQVGEGRPCAPTAKGEDDQRHETGRDGEGRWGASVTEPIQVRRGEGEMVLPC